MTIPATVAAEIRRLFFAEHWKVGTIATQLAVHHDAVRRVLGLLPAQRPSLARPRDCQLRPYHEFITEQLARYPRLRATRLYDMLRERGYSGSVRTVRRYVAPLRPRPTQEAYLRLDPLPGEQAQIDWAHLGPFAVPGGGERCGCSSWSWPTRGRSGPSSFWTSAATRCAAPSCAPAPGSAAVLVNGSSTILAPWSWLATATPPASSPTC